LSNRVKVKCHPETVGVAFHLNADPRAPPTGDHAAKPWPVGYAAESPWQDVMDRYGGDWPE
jgi:hypothetical protein